MDYGTGKGTPLGEFESYRFKNKTIQTLFRYYGILAFIDIPFSIFFFSQIPNWTEDFLFIGILVVLFIMDILVFIFVDNFITPLVTPIKIYSQGIEKKRTIWDMIKKKNAFYPQVSIEKVELRVYDQKDSHNRFRGKGLLLSIFLKGGKHVSLGERGFENLARIQDILTNGAKIQVVNAEGLYLSGQTASSSNVQSHGARKLQVPVTAPVQTSNRFCIHCGAKIEFGSKFCGICGGKQE